MPRQYIVVAQHRKTGVIVVWCGHEGGGFRHITEGVPAAMLSATGAAQIRREAAASVSDRQFLVLPIPVADKRIITH